MPDFTFELPEHFRYPRLSPKIDERDGMYRGNLAHYLNVGLSAIDAIDHALSKKNAAKEVVSVLDLPCGYGRVTRTLRCRFPSAQFTVCDLEKDAVDFCAGAFNARGVYSTKEFDALDLEERFDLIWVGSLITHLDKNAISNFFRFVRRHLSNVGVAVVSSHGPFVAGRIRQSLLDDKPAYGLSLESMKSILPPYFKHGYGFAAYQRHKLSDDHYGASICTERWLRQMSSDAKLSVNSYEHHGWDNHHDIISFVLS